MGSNKGCTLDHSEFSCLENGHSLLIVRELPKDLYAEIKRRAKETGIPIRMYMEIQLRKIVKGEV